MKYLSTYLRTYVALPIHDCVPYLGRDCFFVWMFELKSKALKGSGVAYSASILRGFQKNKQKQKETSSSPVAYFITLLFNCCHPWSFISDHRGRGGGSELPKLPDLRQTHHNRCNFTHCL